MDLYNLVVSAKLTKGGGGGDEPVLIDKSIDANGVYKASDDSADGYKKVTVSVPSSGITPVGTKNITENGVFDVTDFASASVAVPVGVFPSGTSSITANGIYNIESFQSVDVNVSGGGGDHDAEDGIIQRAISGAYTNSRVTQIGNYAFYLCAKLTAVSFPNATSIGAYAFQSCASMSVGYFPKVLNLGSNAFRSCNNLMSLYILASSVATASSNIFTSTPIALSTYTGSFGSIYVPASLVDSYKSATNWSSISARITSYVE